MYYLIQNGFRNFALINKIFKTYTKKGINNANIVIKKFFSSSGKKLNQIENGKRTTSVDASFSLLILFLKKFNHAVYLF